MIENEERLISLESEFPKVSYDIFEKRMIRLALVMSSKGYFAPRIVEIGTREYTRELYSMENSEVRKYALTGAKMVDFRKKGQSISASFGIWQLLHETDEDFKKRLDGIGKRKERTDTCWKIAANE